MSVAEEEVVIISDDDRRLEKTQNLREKIIDVLTETDMDVRVAAKDKDVAKILLASMKDLDDQILKKKKLAVEEKSNETNAAMVAQIARQMAEDSSRNRGTTDYMTYDHEAVGKIPTPDESRFGGVQPKLGEMDQDETNSDVDSFMAIHGKKARMASEIDSNISAAVQNK